MAIRVGVFGATGYTGLELVRLLDAHPEVEITFATSEGSAGKRLRQVAVNAPDVALTSSNDAFQRDVDAAMLCLPHGASATTAARALTAGWKVVDLSADLRLADADSYHRWYGLEHPHPELLPAPYGLPELFRETLDDVDAIAGPGCFATAALLGIAPLARAGLLGPGPLVVDAKSGVSGAGRTPQAHTLFCEVHGNFSPYKPGRTHRHVAEIEQQLEACGVASQRLVFCPHLLPTDRGILATLYLPLTELSAAREAFAAAYAGEPLVELLPEGEIATLGHVVRTPRAVLSLHPGGAGIGIVVCCLDNLLKGAASQAVQCLNRMFQRPETLGLLPEDG